MNEKDYQAPGDNPSRHERLKVILMSFLWLVFFALSFVTFFAIPAVLFLTWAVIAWIIKIRKCDQDDCSGYDRDF